MTALPLSFHLRDREQTEQFGSVLGELLASKASHPSAVVVLLSGDLGAGKTTLVRGLALGLGAADDAVSSPTFTIRMDHRGASRPLVHIDAWRIGPHDLESIGFDELLASSAVVAVEWPERIADALPAGHIRIRLEHADPVEERGEPTRVATIDAAALGDAALRRLAEGLSLLVRAPRIAPPSCPVCGRNAAGESTAELPSPTPFCSARCRMADLGDWLMMRHRIVGSEQPETDE